MTSKRKQLKQLKQLKQYRAWCDQIRALASDNARALALAIVGGHQPTVSLYDLGIVLRADEVVWQRVPADYWWRGQQTWAEQHVSCDGRRRILTEVGRPVLNCAGTLDWLITNQRLATREPNGEVISTAGPQSRPSPSTSRATPSRSTAAAATTANYEARRSRPSLSRPLDAAMVRALFWITLLLPRSVRRSTRHPEQEQAAKRSLGPRPQRSPHLCRSGGARARQAGHETIIGAGGRTVTPGDGGPETFSRC